MNKKIFSTKELVEVALFCTLIIVLGMTPLGYIPTPAFNIVTIHIPVIIGSIILGWQRGAILGFIFGLTSLINAHLRTNVMSIFFSPFISGNILSLVVCFVPRILVGIIPYFIFNFFKKYKTNIKQIGLFISGILGSLTNTVFVMGFIYLFFKADYAKIQNKSIETILKFMIASISFNAIIEAIVAGIFTLAICNILIKLKKR